MWSEAGDLSLNEEEPVTAPERFADAKNMLFKELNTAIEFYNDEDGMKIPLVDSERPLCPYTAHRVVTDLFYHRSCVTEIDGEFTECESFA